MMRLSATRGDAAVPATRTAAAQPDFTVKPTAALAADIVKAELEPAVARIERLELLFRRAPCVLNARPVVEPLESRDDGRDSPAEYGVKLGQRASVARASCWLLHAAARMLREWSVGDRMRDYRLRLVAVASSR